jgi:hypothetical protein
MVVEKKEKNIMKKKRENRKKKNKKKQRKQKKEVVLSANAVQNVMLKSMLMESKFRNIKIMTLFKFSSK